MRAQEIESLTLLQKNLKLNASCKLLMDSYELQDKRLRRIDEGLDKKYEKLEKKWIALQKRKIKVQKRLTLARQRASKNGGADEALVKRSKELRARENQLENE